ncbi:MAG TPA: hypothetical protein VH723_09415 [Candidatus Limnocylindrales bacterium]
MAADLDVEAISEVSGETGFARWLALLIGAAAILAAVLATLQVDAGKQEERALHMASRLSVRVFEGTAGGSPRFSFQVNGMQRALTLAISATAAQIAVLERPEVADAIQARAEADARAAERLLDMAVSMGSAPTASSGLDEATRLLVGSSPVDWSGVAAEQGRQVDIADRFAERGNRALFGLSLVALGGVLTGLAAVLGRGTPGMTAAGAASLAHGAAALLAIAAVLA